MHPLNKAWIWTKLLPSKFVWNQNLKCYEYHNDACDEYILGNRCIGKPTDCYDLYNMFELDDRADAFSKGILPFEEVLKWLQEAQHQEYGCKLWTLKI